MAFLYRHCLEVKLKDLIWIGIDRRFFQKAKVKGVLDQHNLAKLWTLVRRLLEDGWPGADPGPLRGIEAVVNQFHEADPSGQVFRYERDKDTLKQHRHEKLPEYINLATLRRTMDAVYNLLDACEGMMRDEMDILAVDADAVEKVNRGLTSYRSWGQTEGLAASGQINQHSLRSDACFRQLRSRYVAFLPESQESKHTLVIGGSLWIISPVSDTVK